MRHLRLIIGALCLVAACAIIVIALQSGSTTADPPRGAATAAPPAEDPQITRVLVASEAIARGRRIEARMVSVMRVDGPLLARAFTRHEEVTGAVALEDIAVGQIILRNAVLSGSDARPGLSILVPVGMRAVALRVTDEIAVGNFVRPDDRVDIQIVVPSDQLAKLHGQPVTANVPPESALFLQNIQVLSVGEALTVGRDDKAQHMQNITVAVTPDQALKIAAVKQVAAFYLTLRHPADDRVLPGIKARVTEATLGLADTDRRAAPARTSRGRVEMILGEQETVEQRP